MTRQRSMRPNRSNRRQSVSPARTPSHFFKIILLSTIQDKKLGIPEKFVRNFGNELSDVATLTVANGRTWKMGLKKRKNKIWFHDGWQEFVELNSISTGYFLVFRYEGYSKFHVLVFDTTACEVDLSCNGLSIDEEHNHGEEFSVHHEEDIEDDGSVDILGSTMPSHSHCSLNRKGFNDCVHQRAHGKSCSSPSKWNLSIGVGMGTIKDGKASSSLKRPKFAHGYLTRSMKYKLDDHGEGNEFNDVNKSRKGKLKENEMPNSHGSLTDYTKDKNGHLSKKAEDSHSPVPSIRDSGPNNRRKLEKSSSRGNEKHQNLANDRDNVYAATPSNRPASPQVNEYECKNAADKFGPYSTDGMNQRTTSNEHELPAKQNEDVKMFSTKSCSRFFPTRSVTTRAREGAIHAARRFKTESPSFMVILRSTYICNSFMCVPTEFAKKYLSDVSEYIKLQVPDGREWPIKCISKGARRTLSKGWVAFRTENKLKDGDVCVFELIETNEFVLKVSIFRMVEEGQ